ncbi:MAG: permease [Muribaculaceae bacterium]|nr:permease [Muribaculaceae bacterium]
MEYINAFLWMLHSMSPYLLLGFFLAGVLHAFVPAQVYSRYLSQSGWRSVLIAALAGIPLPLCSCGVLPTAVALRKSGASRAASTSFLIATPQTGVDSIVATYSMMGLPFAIVRPVAALITSILGGNAVGALERKGIFEPDAQPAASQAAPGALKPTLAGKIIETFRYGFFEMLQNIGRWLLLGLVVATLITVLVPDDFFSTYARYPALNMLVILLVAIPMYVCATGSIPIAAALMMKGLTPGCALVLLMAGPAANLASVFVISQAFGSRATIAYLVSIIMGALAFGLGIDYLPGVQEMFVSAMPHHHDVAGHMMHVGWFNIVCSSALVVMLICATAAKWISSRQLKQQQKESATMKQFKINGMMCNHCKARVEEGLAALPGVDSVKVDLAQGIAYVEGDVPDEEVRECVIHLGYRPQ